MSLRTKTIDELFDLEIDLHQLTDEENDSSLNQIISLYEELHKKITRDRGKEYESSLPEIRKKLLRYLIRYGTYLKTQFQKDDYTAEASLRKALRYDNRNPIAHYRLGFLNYKKRRYSNSINHFQQAVKHDVDCPSPEYRLTNQQLYNTQLYLANSSLYIAEEAQQALQRLENKANPDNVPQLERSSLYEKINQNEDLLATNAFAIFTPDGESRCSKEKCDDIAFGEAFPDRIILYFTDRNHLLIYNGKDIQLSVNQAEIMRYLFLKTGEHCPATKNAFSEIFTSSVKNGNIPNNTFTQSVRRLKRKMEQNDVPASVIINSRSLNSEPAYYYTDAMPYIIMHRTDTTFILDQ
ncbi:ABC transporter related [Gracilibacillus boraciitolerans JCM 21714]|uniref:ABC transporter related n=1 Tax=Gracilibacillus boraciitolerans JCM 21714 TaxID=1298598 RepID=W4VNF6_9BACI|nr:hypothetical protein [Gracilibacillus boraciitolerans]GAE94686.1 ABC transporter related [Gracilibacillus boraciitolerans JCM 21714]